MCLQTTGRDFIDTVLNETRVLVPIRWTAGVGWGNINISQVRNTERFRSSPSCEWIRTFWDDKKQCTCGTNFYKIGWRTLRTQECLLGKRQILPFGTKIVVGVNESPAILDFDNVFAKEETLKINKESDNYVKKQKRRKKLWNPCQRTRHSLQKNNTFWRTVCLLLTPSNIESSIVWEGNKHIFINAWKFKHNNISIITCKLEHENVSKFTYT